MSNLKAADLLYPSVVPSPSRDEGGPHTIHTKFESGRPAPSAALKFEPKLDKKLFRSYFRNWRNNNTRVPPALRISIMLFLFCFFAYIFKPFGNENMLKNTIRLWRITSIFPCLHQYQLPAQFCHSFNLALSPFVFFYYFPKNLFKH